MPTTTIRILLLAVVSAFTLSFTNCESTGGPAVGPAGVDPNEVAATVNGNEIKMEEVERILKQQARGEESKLSPLELAAARLQVLDGLIRQEVLFQKAQAEETVPSDEEVNSELNRRKTESGVSQEQWGKQLTDSGTSEEELKLSLKKEMAINKLIEKITGKIEPPKDSEIEAFYNGNKEAFKARRGAQFAAIVIDPNKVFEGDTTTNEVEAQQRAKELGDRLLGRRADFATIAREFSEDPQTRARGGDWRYFTEQEMAQTFGQNFANYVMNEAQNGDIIPQAIPLEGKILILKVQQKKEKDEDQTLETPGVREQITKALIDSRKQLLSESYAAVAMSEAKIENFLARKVIENPNELSGARPAAAQNQPANTNAAPANANTENTNADSNAAANAGESNSNAAANSSEGESKSN
ncbi:MAG: SurA N-terminal domain-containing protein [Acidobacteriota bacterium]|nr:MAG: SurA N-terminal domain-containing protein [Acidobacteriota bacterium]